MSISHICPPPKIFSIKAHLARPPAATLARLGVDWEFLHPILQQLTTCPTALVIPCRGDKSDNVFGVDGCYSWDKHKSLVEEQVTVQCFFVATDKSSWKRLKYNQYLEVIMRDTWKLPAPWILTCMKYRDVIEARRYQRIPYTQKFPGAATACQVLWRKRQQGTD